jgi:hypothetical protein
MPNTLGLTGEGFRFKAGLATMTVHPKVDLSKHHVPHTSHLALHHRLNPCLPYTLDPCLPYTLDSLGEGFRFKAGLDTMTVHPKVDLSKHHVPHTSHLALHHRLNPCLPYIPLDSLAEGFRFTAGLSTITVHLWRCNGWAKIAKWGDRLADRRRDSAIPL